MKEKFIICNTCGKRILDPENHKLFDDLGYPICKECFEKYRIKKENNSFIDSIPFYSFPQKIGLPNRNNYKSLAKYCVDYLYYINGSDLHLKSKTVPVFRKGGRLFKICDEILQEEDIIAFAKAYYLGSENLHDKKVTVDYSFIYGKYRFRSNFFHDENGGCLSLRLIRLFSADFNELGLPNELKDIAMRRSGLILITGPTGSGKTTSLAALINFLNHHTSHHILTLEDPIEYIHENKGCIISQREVGRDCSSYSSAIRELLREDPDIIMIGEMRDKDSIEAALQAVETGHIVFSTLHTRGAVSTISRIVDTFPADEQDQVRSQLSTDLLAVCSQQLVPSVEIGKVCLATELMINNTPIAASIRGNKLPMIYSSMQLGLNSGMHTMTMSLDKLLKEGKISKKEHDNYLL